MEIPLSQLSGLINPSALRRVSFLSVAINRLTDVTGKQGHSLSRARAASGIHDSGKLEVTPSTIRPGGSRETSARVGGSVPVS
jgi:hypothetical protein